MSIYRFIPAFLFFILSTVLLCMPGATIPKYQWLATIYADKWVHICMFGMLCMLTNRPLRVSNYSNQQRNRWFVIVMLTGIGYGVIMEFVQKYWVANRSFEIWDIAADSTGCLLAYFFSAGRFLRKG